MAFKGKADKPAETAVETVADTGSEMTVQQRHEVSVNERFKDSQLRDVTSFEDAMRLAREAYGEVHDITDELGNGFRLIQKDDKGKLTGIPFIILHTAFNDGDFGEFASIALVTADNRKLILNDGSSGIADQLRGLVTATGRYGGWMVPGGLRESQYDTCKDCDRPRPQREDVCNHCGSDTTERHTGRTYYLDTSA